MRFAFYILSPEATSIVKFPFLWRMVALILCGRIAVVITVCTVCSVVPDGDDDCTVGCALWIVLGVTSISILISFSIAVLCPCLCMCSTMHHPDIPLSGCTATSTPGVSQHGVCGRGAAAELWVLRQSRPGKGAQQPHGTPGKSGRCKFGSRFQTHYLPPYQEHMIYLWR